MTIRFSSSLPPRRSALLLAQAQTLHYHMLTFDWGTVVAVHWLFNRVLEGSYFPCVAPKLIILKSITEYL